MQPDPLTSREDADHYFGDPRQEGSEHPLAFDEGAEGENAARELGELDDDED